MSLLVQAVDGCSPNCNSGLPDKSSAPAANTNLSNTVNAGTGPGNSTGIAGSTIVDHSIEKVPTTIPVPQINVQLAAVRSGAGQTASNIAATSINQPEPETN